MPQGSLCFISGPVTVNHPVTLGAGAGFGLVGGSLIVNGTVTVGPGAAFGDLNGVYPITVNGSVFIQSNGDMGMVGGTIGGSVLATAPSALELYYNQVSGKVSIAGGGGTNPVLDAIGQTQYQFVDLENNMISGPLTETGYAGPGSQYGYAGVFFENHTGPMTLSNNSGALIGVGDNVINGPATCSGNTPTPELFDASTVSGPIKGDQGAACFG